MGLGHQTTHTGELADLTSTTTGTGVKHHIHGIETLVGFAHGLHEDSAEVVVDVCPRIDDLIVAFLVGDEAHVVVAHDALDLIITTLHEGCLLFGDDDIAEVE